MWTCNPLIDKAILNIKHYGKYKKIPNYGMQYNGKGQQLPPK